MAPLDNARNYSEIEIAPTSENRARRLQAIKAEITEFHSRYKKHAAQTFRYIKKMGVRLI